MSDQENQVGTPKGYRWASTDAGLVLVPDRPAHRETPHSRLKRQARAALTAWRQANNVSVLLIPTYVGKATTASGREVALGRKGQSDDVIQIGRGGYLWAVLHVEYKAGRDTQSEHQLRYQEKCQASGGVYVLCRRPSDLTGALARVLAQHGGLFHAYPEVTHRS